ncbi:MAG: M16 family metallopeptidase [Pirellulales bacterium]
MTALTTALLASVLTAAPAESASARIPAIAFEKYKLPNGLEVILHEDHSTPIVGVNIWYHVGSKNERPGRTGFAHLFEHMMFQGSKHHDTDYFGPLQQAGGQLNGSTAQDRTNYWETVPSNYLDLALWMEADRMGFLLPSMTQEKLDNQRDVVKNERRQSYENRPYGLAYETILAAMYPPEHPYSWPVIGSMADLGAASREDIASFFRHYYHPGNASLCIAGDFNPAEAKRLVAKYFGSLPAGPKVDKLKPWVPELKEAKRIQMTDRVGLAKLYMNWHTVPMFAPDDATLDILGDVLAGGKSSRLYRSLVRDKQIAQDVEASQSSSELAGMFNIVATARPGHTLAELEKAILEELQRVQAEPPSKEEVARGIARYEVQYVTALDSVSGFGGRADRLNMYNVYLGDPGRLNSDFDRYLKVDPAAVQRVAREYLGPKRVTLEVVPGAEQKITPDPRETAATAREELAKQIKEKPVPELPAVKDSFDRGVMPPPAAVPKFALPPIRRGKLSNGLEVLVVENHELPTVNLNLVCKAGRSSDPFAKLGLASLTASVWDEGTGKRSALEIADELALIGANLSISADWDSTSLRLFTLKRQLAKALDVYSDVLRNPSFPEAELGRERNMALGRLIQVRDEPTILARLAVAATLYGQENPYGQPQYGTEASLKAIERNDLASFCKTQFRPDRASLIVVGDITLDEAVRELEKAISGWKAAGNGAAEPQFPALGEPKPNSITLVDKPSAAQSVISVGLVGAKRNSPDYFALSVMNSIFGGQFSSRLNMNLREDKGYTYGARTGFDWRVHQPGPFTATSSVQTAVTAPALVEFLKEFNGMVGQRPVGKEELDFSKTYLTRGYPAGFETPGNVASQLETLVEYSLPDDYFNTVVPKISAVTAQDVLRVAKKYLDVAHLSIIVVGDRAKIESALQGLPAGKNLTVRKFNDEFKLVPVK